MAFNFAGGTDQIYYDNGGTWPQVGCFSFRMKTTQTTANAVPACLWNSLSRFGMGFILNNVANKLTVQGIGVDIGAVAFAQASSTTVNDGAEHIVALNYNTNNGGANSYYIDGNLEWSGNSAAAWTLGPGPPRITLGNGYNAFWAPYVGDLSEIAVWNRQLDVAEITGWLAKKGSPAQLGNGLIFHAPLVRPVRDRYGLPGSQTGTTVSDHGPVIYPRA